MRPCSRCAALLLACVLFSGASGSPMSEDYATGLVVGPTVRAPFLDDHYAVTLAILEDGAFALSGTTTIVTPNPQGGYPQFEVQLYGPTGSSLASFVPRPPATTGGVGSLGTKYLLTWQYFPDQTRASFLTASGGLQDTPFAWPDSQIEYYAAYYRYGAGPTYRFLPIVFYVAGQLGGEPNYQPILQVNGPDAVAIGPPLALAPRLDWVFLRDAAINGNGRFVVLYQRCPKPISASTCINVLQIFRGAGEEESPPLTSDYPFYTLGLNAAIENGGAILLEWSLPSYVNLNTPLFVRLLDPHGSPLTAPMRVTGPVIGPQAVRALENGDFVFTWQTETEDRAGNFSTGFHACYFDTAARQFRAPVLVAQDYLAAEGFHFEMNASGRGLVTWTTFENGIFTGHYKHLDVASSQAPAER
jgi:hypothetical protein